MGADQPRTRDQRQKLLEALQKMEFAALLIDGASASCSTGQKDQLAGVRTELRCALDLLRDRFRP